MLPVANIAVARDAILLLFTTAWDAQTPPVPTLLYAHTRGDPPSSGAWARVSVKHTTSRQVTFGNPGSRRFRSFGFVNVEIYSVAGLDGLTTGDARSQVAKDAFEGVSTAADEIEFRNVRIVEIGADGPWDRVDVLADFEYDTIK